MKKLITISLISSMCMGIQTSMVAHSGDSEAAGQPKYVVLKEHPELKDGGKTKYQPPMFKYPVQARIDRIQGTVIVNAYVNTKGKVIKVERVSGPPELVGVVIPYVMQFEFYPLIVDNSSMPFIIEIKCPFKLH